MNVMAWIDSGAGDLYGAVVIIIMIAYFLWEKGWSDGHHR